MYVYREDFRARPGSERKKAAHQQNCFKAWWNSSEGMWVSTIKTPRQKGNEKKRINAARMDRTGMSCSRNTDELLALSAYRYPQQLRTTKIKDLHGFEATMLHSMNWDHSVDLERTLLPPVV